MRLVRSLSERKSILEIGCIKTLLFSAIVLSASIIGAIGIFQSQSKPTTVKENHFSVHWLGFNPIDYSSNYPEYYVCINNLRNDTLQMQIALLIKNQENRLYYFKVDKYGTPPSGWTIMPRKLGSVGIDESKQFIYDGALRSRPTLISEGRLTETINLIVQAYYDEGYTSLYSQDNFSVTFNLLDLTSTQWTVLLHDDFDDGGTHGWSYYKAGNGPYAEVKASLTYYRSPWYSLELHAWTGADYSHWVRAGFHKDFDIRLTGLNVSEIYLIYSIKSEENWRGHTESGVMIDGKTLFKSDVTPSTHTWYQFAVPLEKGAIRNVKILVMQKEGANMHTYAYLDDVYVIYK
jgi:hypothetical protein